MGALVTGAVIAVVSMFTPQKVQFVQQQPNTTVSPFFVQQTPQQQQFYQTQQQLQQMQADATAAHNDAVRRLQGR